MPREPMIVTLAKVVIAAAWADGALSLEEVDSLKDLLFRYYAAFRDETTTTSLPWAQFEMYIEIPVGDDERHRLVQELRDVLRTRDDKLLALAAVEQMIQADGLITGEEKAVLAEITAAVETADVTIFGRLGQAIRGALNRRAGALSDAPNRDRYLSDYHRNKIYYGVRLRLDLGEADLDLADGDLRKLSAAGGLMARVAAADRRVSEDEFETMISALHRGWSLSPEQAGLVAQVAVSEVGNDLDVLRLAREFVANTSAAERARFVDVLFAVAAADGGVSEEELNEIQAIGRSLMLSSQTIQQARERVE